MYFISAVPSLFLVKISSEQRAERSIPFISCVQLLAVHFSSGVCNSGLTKNSYMGFSVL